MGRLLAVSVSQPAGNMAEFPLPAALGRFRRQHLLHRILAVLVSGPGARLGVVERPDGEQNSQSRLFDTVRRLARRRRTLVAL